MPIHSRLLVAALLLALFVASWHNQVNAMDSVETAEEVADRWNRVACLLSEKVGLGGAKSFNLATGFFVASGDGFALVTAAPSVPT